MKWTGKKHGPKRAKILMAASYLLLLVFAVQWLHMQYVEEKRKLQYALGNLFEDVQQGITDSLLLVTFVHPAMAHAALYGEQGAHPGKGFKPATDNIRQLSSLLFSDQDLQHALPLAGLKIAVRNIGRLSPEQEAYLFRIDTTVFNKIYADRMRNMGWDFPVYWVNKHGLKKTGEFIFIPNTYLHNGYGIRVTGYQPYLLRQLGPQAIFILILLSAILLAFYTTYRSLLRQIQLGNLKNDFVSNISHELKTPIATVKVAIEAVRHFEAAGQRELASEYMEMAGLEVERLELLVNRSLHNSVLESGKLSILPEPHDLKTIIEEVLQAYQVKFLAHNTTVRLNCTGNCFRGMVDKMHIQGVLINLLDNSLKYGHDGLTILIHLEEKDEAFQISVADNGPGIPEAYLPKVFEKFFRVPSDNIHNIKGYGLGLSYAAQVIQQHHGHIAVCNNTPEEGCTFTLFL